MALDPRFTSQTLIELPFPAALDTIDALITTYLDEVRRPASRRVRPRPVRFDGWRPARSAQVRDEGPDRHGREPRPASSRRFRAHEEVTIVAFSSEVDATREFTIDDTTPMVPT
ncbi:MAG: hypothetical protein WKF78_11950 [Candidatus Limnocylindrales bacterium]